MDWVVGHLYLTFTSWYVCLLLPQARGHPGGPVRAAPRGLQGHPHRPGAVPPRLGRQEPVAETVRKMLPHGPDVYIEVRVRWGGWTGSLTNAQGVS